METTTVTPSEWRRGSSRPSVEAWLAQTAAAISSRHADITMGHGVIWNEDKLDYLRRDVLYVGTPERPTVDVSGAALKSAATQERPLSIRPPLLRAKGDPALTNRVLALAEKLWTIVLSKALQSSFPLTRGQVDAEHDPEEGNATPVLRIYTTASAVQTLAFWDSLEVELTQWLEHLTPRDGEAVLNEVALRFHWK